MPKDKPKAPQPVITDTLLSKIKDQLELLQDIPECLILKQYFNGRITHKPNTPLPSYPKGSFAIKALFPEAANTPNIDKLLEYYIVNYPAYSTLSKRFKANKYKDKKSSFDHWYKEFFCYLKIKIDDASHILKVKPTTSNNAQQVQTADASTLTDFTEPQEWNISNFCVEIMGPSNVINNLVFMKSNADVVIRYHKSKHSTSFNKDGSLTSLFNYPNVEVELNIGKESPLISIKRSCECLYDRFLMTKCTPVQQQIYKSVSEKRKLAMKVNPCVQSIELVEAKESVSYEYSFIHEYVRILLDLIKNCTDKVSDSLKTGLNFFLEEFLADILELNLYNRKVIATNTAVKFVIGPTKYERYRFVQSSDVNFVEILTPLVTLHFKDFNPMYALDHQQDLFFKQLRMFAQNLSLFEDVLTKDDVLKFICKVCGEAFNNSEGIIEHFHKAHEPAYGVICEKCQLSLQVDTLAGNRWKHTCFE